jgi:hypothetical protein
MTPTDIRLQLLDNGWSPIPVRGKVPVIREWERFCRSYPSDDDVEAWERNHRRAGNTGIALGRQVCIDIDVGSDEVLARQIRAEAVACFGSTPFVRVGRAPKVALVYRADGPIASRNFKAASGNGDGIDILSDGKQFVAFGIHPDTGQLYQWIGEASPLDAAPDEATPAITEAQVHEFLDRVHHWMPLGGSSANGKRPAGSGPPQQIIRDADGLVVDGRERFLADCVWRAAANLVAAGEPLRADAVAGRAWGFFTDPTNGARLLDGRWTERHALQKACSTIRRLNAGKATFRQTGAAAAPTYPDLTKPVEEARAAVEAAIRRHLQAAADYRMAASLDFNENTDLDPPVHAIRVGTGVGKTTTAALLIAQEVKAGASLPFLIAVPTHRLGDEIVRQFDVHGVTAQVFRGRSAADPNRQGRTMCDDLEAVQIALDLGASVEQACCKAKGTQCAFYDTCAYQRQKTLKPEVWIVAHQLLFSAQGAIGKVQGVFIDEGFWQSGTWSSPRGLTIEQIEADLPFDPKRSEVANDLSTYRGKLARALRRQPEAGGLRREHLIAEGLRAEDCTAAIALEWQFKPETAIYPGMPADERRAAARAAKGAKHIRAAERTWKAVRDLLRAEDEASVSGRIYLADEDTDHGRSRVVKTRGVKPIASQWQTPTLIMDATLPAPEILKAFYPGVQVLADVEAAMPHVTVRQVLGAPVSKKRLLGSAESDARRNLKAVRWAILWRHLEVGRARTLVIAQKDVADWLNESGLPRGIAVEHFNNVAGLDRYKGFRLLISIGRTMPDVFQVEGLAGALTGFDPLKTAEPKKGPRWYGKTVRGIRLRDGSGVGVDCDQHPDPVAEAVRWQICEGELIQALGRGRGVNRTPETPLDIDIWADVVLPITVDQVSRWDEVEAGAAVEMLIAGVWLESPSDMARCWPKAWETDEAARRWQSRSTSGQSAIENILYSTLPACGRYQMPSARQKWRTFRFDPSVRPDPRTWLEERLGPLAGFEVVPLTEEASNRKAA